MEGEWCGRDRVMNRKGGGEGGFVGGGVIVMDG